MKIVTEEMILFDRTSQIPQSPSTPIMIKNESSKRNVSDDEDDLLLTQLSKKS
jgi:hypothetical protein